VTKCHSEIWAGRYVEALDLGVMKLRAETRGKAVRSLKELESEVACDHLLFGLQQVNLITAQTEPIIRLCLERALAHSRSVYADPKAALRAAYQGVTLREDNVPILLTGLAGVGKSRIRISLQRILAKRTEVLVDEAHPPVPLIGYADCTIGQQSSTLGVLRPLAHPEIASGRVKVKTSEISQKCASWQRVVGSCLLGVDETQFMAQSDTASTLITRTLLALADVGLPWFYTANYSLIWKMLARPSEATQRLLSHPIVVLPDPPNSEDWMALMKEFDVVVVEAFEFKLVSRSSDLWNLCAGLKRLLIKLLVHSYRLARDAGSHKVAWEHVSQAFLSVTLHTHRREVDLLIAYAGQGGDLRRDLKCPFDGPAITARSAGYQQQLRAARDSEVARQSVKSAMTGEEKAAVEGIERISQPVVSQPGKAAVPRAKTGSLEQLLGAGKGLREMLRRKPHA